MPIKVIGAGLGRTGTLSLKHALERLGFSKCYHMVEVLAHPQDARVWDGAAHGRPVDWDTLFQGYQATVDWPACSFYRELLQGYPEAKVILSVRDPERWYESVKQTIYYARHAFPAWAAVFAPRMRRFSRMVDRLIWNGMFRGRFEDKPYAIEVFDRHNQDVRRSVPPGQLLVFEVKEGWGPLCSFLGVPVPNGEPFPHVNDTVEFRAGIARTALVMRVVGYAVVGLVTLFMVAVMRSRH